MPNDQPDWTTAAAAPQKQLGTFNAPPNATTSRNFAIDPGTHCVGILLNSLTNVNQLQVTGVTTGIVYANNLIGTTGFGTLYFVPVLSIWDTSVNVAVTMGIGAQTATLFVAEILDPEIVAIYQSAALQVQATVLGQPLSIRLQDWTGVGLGPSIIVDSAGFHDVAVQQPVPALWQAATGAANIGSLGVLNAGATQVIVAGVAGQVLRLFGVSLGPDAGVGTTVAVEDTAGNQLAEVSMNSGLPNFHWMAGVPLVSGRGVQIHNIGPVAATPRGSISFSQG